MGAFGSERQTQRAPGQDGTTTVDIDLGERDISIAFEYMDDSIEKMQVKRQYLAKVCNPKLGLGELKYEDNNSTYIIPVEVDAMPTSSEESFKLHQESTVQFTAPSPYWQSVDLFTDTLAAFVPKFQFPFEFPVQFGERGSETTVYNNGHVPCPVEIQFNGPATDPIVTNRTTGEFIRVKRELFEGDRLIINTAEGRKRKVVIERSGGQEENAWHYIDIWESTLFMLEPGENNIEYDATAGGIAAVNIMYRERYVGI